MTKLQYTNKCSYGKDSRHCRVCHTTRGLISKYNLLMCRRCFRERAEQIGFVKVERSLRNQNLIFLLVFVVSLAV
ncbi:unnamed protein product [Albugo candida]|uniref:40S ribosomal protein S29 n=1 Tax=Albugo candida TaxID=65357 RepID=A0A024GKL9_9STRA|nr:unnamed protein product [Albugo candida]|eukprot:CCI46875.1 unnamed protein product [Albugo candida]